MTQQYAINVALSKLDLDLYTKFWTLMKADAQAKALIGGYSDGSFTSDDFRGFGLDRFLEDTQHQLGALFLRWKVNKLIEPTGQTKCSTVSSNHGHRLPVYKLRGW